MEEIIITIKYTNAEVGLLINSLVMTCTTQITEIGDSERSSIAKNLEKTI